MKPPELEFGTPYDRTFIEAGLMGLIALISTMVGWLINQMFGLHDLGSIPLVTSMTVSIVYIIIKQKK